MDTNPDVELRNLWQQMAPDTQVMSPESIRARAEQLDASTRGWRLATALLFALLLMVEAWQVWRSEELVERAGDLLTMAALVYVGFRFRRHRLAAPPVALGRTHCVDFLRTELVRQRDLSKDSWSYLLPFVPGVTLALFGGGLADRPASQNIALVIFGVALFLGVAWWNARAVRKHQREIDTLNAS